MSAAHSSTTNDVTLDPIIMISWKLLAVFHDPIHDFGLNIDRMCSIVRYINNLKEDIERHEAGSGNNPSPTFLGGAPTFLGGGKKKYPTVSTIGTLYLEERNIGSIQEPDPEHDTGGIHRLYEKLYNKYMVQREFYNSSTGTTLTGYTTISSTDNQSRVYGLQLYNQFFTNITKLIDLFKVLIVIQVVEKHRATSFNYTMVQKSVVLNAITELANAVAGVGLDEDDDEHGEKALRDNRLIHEEIGALQNLLHIFKDLFTAVSSNKCHLQLDLLNSHTFNNLARTHFSCYFYNIKEFFAIFIQQKQIDPLFSGEVSHEEHSEEDAAYNGLEIQYKYEYEFEYEYEGGGRIKPHDSKRPFILKGGAPTGKALKWVNSKGVEVAEHNSLKTLMDDWIYNKSGSGPMYDKYDNANIFFDRLNRSCSRILKLNFPILYSKMVKDIAYHKAQIGRREEGGPPRGRTTPQSMVITKIRDYMNELVSEVKALEAELDNQTKRVERDAEGGMEGGVDTNITNRISKLFAKKGLEYASAALRKLPLTGDDAILQKNGLDYIQIILTNRWTELKQFHLPPTGNIKFEILYRHIMFLGFVYVSTKKCLPDIDAKLIDFWRGVCGERYSGFVQTDAKLRDFSSWSSRTLRVINNGIPSDLKNLFNAQVMCPTSSVCDSMGNFGSCAGTKRANEFYSMNIKIVDSGGYDYYDVYSKIDHSTILKVISNSFNLNFGREEDMVIEAKYGNVNLNEKPEMLSANNVFRKTLEAIEICFRESPISNVDLLWNSLESDDNFKRIITPTCMKATGDINQEFNSIVNNGGYDDIRDNREIINVINNSKMTLGLAGDRPSGVRMILLALFALDRRKLIPKFVVGYANSANGLYVSVPPLPGKREGGRIRKTKFRKPKMIKTRKNKSHHYKIISTRRKYNNKTKNRKQ